MAPDRICFQNLALPYRGWSEDSEVWGLTVPRARISHAELLRTCSPMISVPIGSPPGMLLSGALCTAWEAARRGAGTGHELAAALVGLVNGVLDPVADRLRDDARLVAMKSYLRRRLADPDLSGTNLQQHFHYSRATVYRLFEPDGGVAHFIRHERLRRCHEELTHPGIGTTVRAVAARWGYPDPARFARAFRSRYGSPPAALLREARSHAEVGSPGRRPRAAHPPQMSSTKRPSARSSASQS